MKERQGWREARNAKKKVRWMEGERKERLRELQRIKKKRSYGPSSCTPMMKWIEPGGYCNCTRNMEP